MALAEAVLYEQISQEQLETCLIWHNGSIQFEYEQADTLLQQVRPINSCTKSVVSLLCCIGMDNGLFPAPDELAEHYFPKLKALVPQHFRRPTIEHLLTLSVGFKWQEFGGIQSFPTMKRSPNWLEFLFSQPIVREPGTRMCYNSGISQMLTTLLTETSGMTVAAFAEHYLFHHLNISQYNWLKDKQGIYTGGFGLFLTPQDMLKVGLLCLAEGSYNNKQLVSSTLLAQATSPLLPARLPAYAGYYGWHWWIDDIQYQSKNVSFYYARGYGGQFIFIVPKLSLVVSTTKNQKLKGQLPLEWFKAKLLPSYVDV